MIPLDDSFEPDSEECAHMLAHERKFESLCDEHGVIGQELRDYPKHTDRQLRDLSRERRAIEQELRSQYQYDASSGTAEIGIADDVYISVDRYGSECKPSRKNKRRMKKVRRKYEREFTNLKETLGEIPCFASG
jgi:hypothetical protein